MQRTLTKATTESSGEQVTVKGWVNSRRDHGGLIFIDLRDHTGIVQLTIDSECGIFDLATSLRDEYVIEATGKVVERDEKLKNPNLESGNIEIMVEELKVLNKSEPLPIQINSSQKVNEEHRLTHRYLDLRRDHMQTMLKKRSEFYKVMRRYMESQDFTEIATPILANSSPEGARDFLVPSRMHPGDFYALPQAPQQFKQLLMVGGVPRYYQFAACFRDEDPRADRLYGEFYQLDMEMAFVEDGQEVRSLMEPLIRNLVTDFAGKTILGDTVPQITHAEAVDRYGSDKPDLRFDLELVDLTQDLKDCGFGVFSSAIKDGGVVKAIRVENKFSRSEIDDLTAKVKSEGVGGLPYMTVEGGKAVSSIAKFFDDKDLAQIITKMGAKDGDTIFFGSDKRDKVNKVLGSLRNHLGDVLGLKDENVVSLLWVIEFPFYEFDEKANKIDFGHNPFSMPKGGLDGLEAEDKLSIVADQYDMVMNGYEICSGAVRNHNPDVMYEAFGALGYDKEYVEAKFGAMLSAFKFGAPPHAGCAFGLDRMFMVLTDNNNVREIVAFPKNGSGVDLMMKSPSVVEDTQLDELHVKTVLPEVE